MPRITRFALFLGISSALCQYAPPAVTRPCSFTVADFNRDGLPDLASACFGDRSVGILLNDRHGSLLEP